MRGGSFIPAGTAVLAIAGLTLAGSTVTLSNAVAAEPNAAKRYEIDVKLHA